MIVTIPLNSEELGSALTIPEIVEVCHQVCAHIFKIISAHYESRPMDKLILGRMSTAWQLRLGLLGRLGCEKDSDYNPLDLEVVKLSLDIGEFNDKDELATVAIEHSLAYSNLSHICPDTLLDYLLILLQESIKSILPKVPNELNYVSFSEGCIQGAKDLIHQLRPFASRIPNTPKRNSNTMLVNLLVEVANTHF